jgi:hypothetical protein
MFSSVKNFSRPISLLDSYCGDRAIIHHFGQIACLAFDGLDCRYPVVSDLEASRAGVLAEPAADAFLPVDAY